jgi:hypothetical protein
MQQPRRVNPGSRPISTISLSLRIARDTFSELFPILLIQFACISHITLQIGSEDRLKELGRSDS